MFKCAITGKFSPRNVKPIRLITERRTREYVESHVDEDDGIRRERTIGWGWEIVKEIDVTLEGLGKWCATHPDDLDASLLLEKMKKHEAAQKAAQLRASLGQKAAA